MIFLNEGCGRQAQVVPAKSETYGFQFRARRYVLDPNTMLLALLDEEQEVPDNWGVPWKPTCPLARPACGHLVLEVTDACNMLCKYCFVAEDGDRSRGKINMTFETAVQAISEFFIANGQIEQIRRMKGRRVSVGFFGGEPLLRKPLIRQVVEFNERTFGPAKCHFHVTTNGTLIDEEWAQFLSQHNFSLIVSVDGPQEVHDADRKYRDGAGSYKDVLKGLNWLRMAAPRVAGRTTLRATYTNEGAYSIRERLEHLNNLCDRQFGAAVSVEPAFLGENVCYDRGKAALLTPDPLSSDGDRWGKELHEAADWYIERLWAEKHPRYHHFRMQLKRLLGCRPSFSECGASKGYFSVGADGTIYACHRETCTKVGDVHDGGIDHELAAPWQDNRYYARKGCSSCVIRNICGGGCREISGVQHGDIRLPVASECAHKFLWFKEAAHILAELRGNEKAMAFLKKHLGLGRQSCATR